MVGICLVCLFVLFFKCLWSLEFFIVVEYENIVFTPESNVYACSGFRSIL